MAVIAARRTTLSRETETRWRLENSARSGLSAAVAWMEPIWVRSAAIFALTVNCEISVAAIMTATHSAAGEARLANERVRANAGEQKNCSADDAAEVHAGEREADHRAGLIAAGEHTESSWRDYEAQEHVASEPQA